MRKQNPILRHACSRIAYLDMRRAAAAQRVAFLVVGAALLLLGIVHAGQVGADAYRVRLDPGVSNTPMTGRLVLFFVEDHPGPTRRPLDAPFYDDPQPVAAIDVRELTPGGHIVIDENAMAFPETIDSLHGRYLVQAILDQDDTRRSMLEGPGNVYSDIVGVELSSAKHDQVTIRLKNRVNGDDRDTPDIVRPNLKWVRLRSERLSAFYGRDIFHRAGVALPPGYNDPENASRRWPAIYVIPGFGGRHDSAANYALMLSQVEREMVPQAVWIVLDPDAPLGHHGFCDSANNGPRGSALVEEFIPHLESILRLDARPEARLLYGHSSGGWSALWLQTSHPAFFGGCWSSAPDPVDFTRFQFSNLIRDRNLYEYAPGQATPSYRRVDMDGRDIVLMTVRDEARMESVIDPRGRSGQQWDAWEAMWSPRDPETGLPRPMFDSETGAIDPRVVVAWRSFDIRLKAIRTWDTLGPVFRDKIRVFCGEYDSFYLNRAVERLRELVELRLGDDHGGHGYIRIVPNASHGSIVRLYTQQMHDEMIAHLATIAPAPDDE